MYKKKNKKINKKQKMLYMLLIISFITVGYSLLSAKFNINGNAKISMSTWNIYFDNLNIVSGSVPVKAGGRTPTIPTGSKNTTTLEWDVELKKTGEFYEFIVDIVNEGSIDAEIETISMTPVLTKEKQKVMEYSVTYVANNSALSVKDALPAGETVSIRVRVAFKKDIQVEDLDVIEEGGIDETLTITINYIQADGTENRVEQLSGGAQDLIVKSNSLLVSKYSSGDTGEMYQFEHPATAQLGATIDYRYIGDTHCSYDNGAYRTQQRAGGTCANIYKKTESNTVTYETSCEASAGVTCEEISGTLKEIKNYINFNCNGSTCETWRIIGVFGGKIKIIRDESIGMMNWDYKGDGVGSSTHVLGSNDWTDSQLMLFLNEGKYYKKTYTRVGNYIYDDKSPRNLIYEVGKEPRVIIAGATTYTGTANDWQLTTSAKSQAVRTTYYLGGYNNFVGVKADEYYSYERGTNSYNETLPTKWQGVVGLMYASDYVYTFAKEVNTTCYDTLHLCNNSGAYDSWLFSGLDNWTITPGRANDAYSISNRGSMADTTIVYIQKDIRPTVYLKANTVLTGDGTKANPYNIS